MNLEETMMSFEKEGCTAAEVAAHLEGLADAVREGHGDFGHLHALGLLEHLLAHCCARDELLAVRAADVANLRARAQDARAGNLELRQLWEALRPILDGLFA
jgi:hypothetical protein